LGPAPVEPSTYTGTARALGVGAGVERAGGVGAVVDRAGGVGAVVERAGGAGAGFERAGGVGAVVDRAGGPGPAGGAACAEVRDVRSDRLVNAPTARPTPAAPSSIRTTTTTVRRSLVIASPVR
jgi:hypothetical protein